MLADEQPVDAVEMGRQLGYSPYTVRRMACATRPVPADRIPGHKSNPDSRSAHWRFYPSEVREHREQRLESRWNQSPQSRGRKRVA